jgi:hypothetical protein
MQSMRKWFSGKVSKQEFDKEAREIVTDNYGIIIIIIIIIKISLLFI